MKYLKSDYLFIVFSALMMTSFGSVARGEIAVSGENVTSAAASQATSAFYTPDIVADDLIDVSQPSLLNWNKDKTPFFESTTLNDGIGCPPTGGTLGSYLPATFGTKGKLPFTYTFNLKVNNYTQSYDIAEIRTYAGWNENGSALGDQKYELLVSTIDTTNFISLGTFTYAPFDNSDPNRASGTKVVLTESSGGAITTGVDAIRFVFMDHGFANINSSIDGTVYHEVDVIGTPVTPYLYPVSYVYDGSGQGALPSTSPAWPDSGGVELINGILPSSVDYRDVQWVGFLDDAPDDGTTQPQVTFDMGSKYVLEQADVTYFHSTSQAGGSVTSPESVWVSVSADGVNWSAPVEKTGFDGSAGDEIRTTGVDMGGMIGRYVRLDFRNTGAWTFLGEIAFKGREPLQGTVIIIN